MAALELSLPTRSHSDRRIGDRDTVVSEVAIPTIVREECRAARHCQFAVDDARRKLYRLCSRSVLGSQPGKRTRRNTGMPWRVSLFS